MLGSEPSEGFGGVSGNFSIELLIEDFPEMALKGSEGSDRAAELLTTSENCHEIASVPPPSPHIDAPTHVPAPQSTKEANK